MFMYKSLRQLPTNYQITITMHGLTGKKSMKQLSAKTSKNMTVSKC